MCALPDIALQQLANAMEQKHELPDSLLSSWTAMINSSGKPVSPMKVRPISVLSVVYRLYAKSRLSTLEDWLDKALPPCIWSYIPGRDVRSPLMSLASRIENSQKPMVEEDTILLSLDLSKAFPSASREQMWAALSHLGLPSPILGTLTSMYQHGRTRMRLGGRIVCDRDYSLRRGIHQGCPLSVMAFLGLQAQIPSLIAADCPRVSLIIFADDVTLVSDSIQELERAAQLIARYYKDCHITLNPQKTRLWSAKGRRESIVLEGVQIEPLNRIKLLGVEYADLSHARPDIERTMSYHRTLGNPQEKLCLEMVLSGAMLTRARVHKREPHLQGCICGEGVDDDHHRYWDCKLVAKSRGQLPDEMDDWPRISRLVGWVLEGDHHTLFQIKELQSHMLRVVSHFLHLHQKRTFLQDGEGCDDGGDDSGGGSRGASGDSGAPRQASDGDRLGEELCTGGGQPPPMQGRDAPQEGETTNWDGRKRGNKRTLPLPEHIQPTSRSVLPGQSAPKRLQCICGTIALDANRTRFLQTHMGCAERPRKSRRVNVLTGAERKEMEEVLGIPWSQHTQRAKRLAVEAAASH